MRTIPTNLVVVVAAVEVLLSERGRPKRRLLPASDVRIRHGSDLRVPLTPAKVSQALSIVVLLSIVAARGLACSVGELVTSLICK